MLAQLSAANAADMYAGGMKDVAFVPPPLWTGLYIGAHVGGAWADLDTADRFGVFGPVDSDGGFGFRASSAAARSAITGRPTTSSTDLYSASKLISVAPASHSTTTHSITSPLINDDANSGFYADFTGRLGYAAGPALFYIKGGWAFFDGGIGPHDNRFTPALGVPEDGISGWTFGGGVEYKFAPNWSAKIEYRHFDFGNFNEILTPAFDSRFDRNLTADAVTLASTTSSAAFTHL